MKAFVRDFAVFLALCGAAAGQSSRLLVIIGDLHLGVGRQSNESWHPYEDARWAAEFRAFLEWASKEGKGQTDLVINGDLFELWQSREEDDCTDPADKNVSCSEAEARRRLETVLRGHQKELAAIGAFAREGGNRVVIVPGNHDAALLYPSVAAAALEAIGAPRGNCTFEARGYWLSPDRRIYVEHGQQIGREVNRYRDWPKPFVTQRGVVRLERPWGEQFVQRYYSAWEKKYPIIDNLSEDALGVRYGVAAEGLQSFGALERFLEFYVTQVSARQFLSTMGDGDQVPAWDVAAVRKSGGQFLPDSLPGDDPLRAVVAGELTLDALADIDIEALCNLRYELIRQETRAGKPASVAACPQRSLGALTQSIFTPRDQVFTKHLNETSSRLKSTGETKRDFDLFVYSHTHLADPGFFPQAPASQRWKPFVVNTGAWQRTATPLQLEQIRKSRQLDDKRILTLTPEDLPGCYATLVVAPYSERPSPAVRYWRKGRQAWEIGETCP